MWGKTQWSSGLPRFFVGKWQSWGSNPAHLTPLSFSFTPSCYIRGNSSSLVFPLSSALPPAQPFQRVISKGWKWSTYYTRPSHEKFRDETILSLGDTDLPIQVANANPRKSTLEVCPGEARLWWWVFRPCRAGAVVYESLSVDTGNWVFEGFQTEGRRCSHESHCSEPGMEARWAGWVGARDWSGKSDGLLVNNQTQKSHEKWDPNPLTNVEIG